MEETPDFDAVRLPDGDIVVRRRPSFAAGEFARTYYEDGRQRDLGIALEVPCAVDGAACATIYWTTDATEAEYRLMPTHGLKLGVASPQRRARTVGSVKWWLAARQVRMPRPTRRIDGSTVAGS